MRCGFLEGNAGWLPFWLGRLDDHCIRDKRQGMWFDSDALKLTPSEYFKRQGFVACDGDEFGLKGTVTLVGEDYVVWNTDYPHDDAPDPDRAVTDLLSQDSPRAPSARFSGTTRWASTASASSPSPEGGATMVSLSQPRSGRQSLHLRLVQEPRLVLTASLVEPRSLLALRTSAS